MDGGFSILQFSFVSFFHVLMSNQLNQPTHTDLLRLAETMVMAEEEPNKELLEELGYLYYHTDEEININLASLEMLVFFQIQRGAGLNKELEINGKQYKIIDLYSYLDKVNKQLIKIVVGIAKLYNLEVPMAGMSSGGSGGKSLTL